MHFSLHTSPWESGHLLFVPISICMNVYMLYHIYVYVLYIIMYKVNIYKM